LCEGAKVKGIDVMASGDFTHPAYFSEIRRDLGPSEDGTGLYSYGGMKFILSCEISLIYSGKLGPKRMHHLVLAPSLDVAAQINDELGKRGNLKSDGRPILGISSPEFADILPSISPEIAIIPAHCLLPGTEVQCNPKIKKIEKIMTGDLVYTHKGRKRKVTKTFKRSYKGDIYKIIPWYFSLGVATTPEHPVYAIKTVKNCSWTKGLVCKPTVSHLRVCYHHFYEQYKPQWVLARDIEKGDVLIYPRLNSEIVDLEKINLKRIFRGVEKDTSIPVNQDFCRLIGYYLAEGYSNGRDAVAFTFSPHECEYLEDVKKLMKSLFGVDGKQGKTKGDLIFYSRSVMWFFENLIYDFGSQRRAFAKRIPNWMLFLPLDKQAGLFLGWWRGDKGSTSSKLLANQMKMICLRLGIVPGIRVDTRADHSLRGKHTIADRKISAGYDNFIFNSLTFFEDKFDLLKKSEFKRFDYKRDIRHGWVDDDYIYMPVRKIEKTRYDGYVYNLEVEEDNSYLTDYAAVHNCWTPWFSIFGSKSGVDSVEQAFEDKADKIFALETGLSSDPAMNWMLSSLDKYSLVSNSDAHSPEKLGREANVFDLPAPSYRSIMDAIKTRKGFVKTYEFYPEEGKYHYDGHRDCKVLMSPWESKERKDICPVCRKKITVGVLHRVADLADRKFGFKPENSVPFQHIVPVTTVISKAIKKPETSVRVAEEYDKIIRFFGTEFAVYESDEARIRQGAAKEIADALIKVKSGGVRWIPGYDGVFGELVLDENAKATIDKKQRSLDDY